MSKLILTRGIPASGKTTFAKAWVAEDPKNRARVNRDDLRFTLFNSYWGETVDEVAVTIAQHSAVKALLSSGRDVIADDTNLRAKTVQDWYKLSDNVEFVDFPIDIEEAVTRDFERMMGQERYVGEDIIRDFASRYTRKGGALLAPPVRKKAEPFDHAPYVPGDTPAYSWDIDGTLAHMTGRSPYDPTLYHTDIPDYDVLRLMRQTQALGFESVILTGRSEDHKRETEAWLTRHGIDYDALFMRPSGDQRNDAIIKSEMVDKYVSHVYDIQMHFDDRNRVVDALRAKGIKVAQVNPGDF